MSGKPRILCTRRLPPNVEARLVRDYDATLNPEDRLYSAEDLVAGSESRDGILCAGGDPMTAGVVERLPESVRIIATYSVGYEHVAVEAARARGIVVTNTPDVLNDATADVAMLCLLGAARRGAEGDRMVRAGEWAGWYSTMLLGVHVTGKRLGIFGIWAGSGGRWRGAHADSTWRSTTATGAASRPHSKTARSGTTPRNRCSR